jgi:hypothetical protein
MTLDPERVDSATFAPERLRKGRSRSLVVAGWLAAVGAIVGLGVAGHGVRVEVPAQTGASGPVVVASTQTADTVGLPVARILLTSQPATSISSGRVTLTVQGLAFRVDHVVVDVVAGDNVVVAEETINTADPDGGIRPLQTPTFETSFERSAPRSPGALFVVVTAFDDLGIPVGFVREAAVIGGLSAPTLERLPRTNQG